ncbi:hypothetical protein BC936DRAFT_148936 [Jimgerdemannia flammicorona]|uniref:Uncharacterized protein n=1 Tax=Jimgerdemannia flammicorona TaxID=994334 RepID=A0A433D1Z8_9FUNG|nr:hypothetical protein BC936DRAFT_148936 [Jimgerdemannia flammicorona]
MCVLRVRARGEPDGLVASGEADVKPADEGVDVVVARRRQKDRETIAYLDGVWARDDGLNVDDVDEGFLDGDGLDGRKVKAVDVVPVWKWEDIDAYMQIYKSKVLQMPRIRTKGLARYSQPILSSLYSPSSMAAMYIVALSGNMRPSLACANII